MFIVQKPFSVRAMLWNIALGFDKDSRYQLSIQLSAKAVQGWE
jgi:hypothetical protein